MGRMGIESSRAERLSVHRPRGVRIATVAASAIVLLFVAVVLSLAVGSRWVAPTDVLHALVAPGNGAVDIIVRELRVPRTVTAVLVGCALGVAGVLMQAVTRNPLADPGLLGVNAGASAAVVVAIGFLGVGSASGYVWFALGGAGVAASLVYLVGQSRRRDDPVGMVLAGVALGACLGSFVGIVTLLDDQTFESFRFWVVGSFERRDLGTALTLAPFIAAGLVLAFLLARSLNQLMLGPDLARSLGIDPVVVTLLAGLAISLLCGAATAAAGPLGFIGLLVAHAVRRVVGPDLVVALPLAGLAGAVLAVTGDVVGRVIALPGEVEVGIVAAFLGAPLLLLLLARRPA